MRRVSLHVRSARELRATERQDDTAYVCVAFSNTFDFIDQSVLLAIM